MSFRLSFFTVLLVLLLAVGCSGPAVLQAPSLSQAPTIDGAVQEWGGTFTDVGDRSVSMSVLPADSVLYVALLIQDRELIRSVAQKGLIVWVDPAGGHRHTYGVRYPFGLQAQRAQDQGANAEAGADPPSALDRVLQSDLGVLRNDTLRRRQPAHFSPGLRASATLAPGSLVYELAIPVRGSASTGTRSGLYASLEGPVGVGLETPESDEDFSSPSRGIPSVTGRGGRGRVPRGRRRGRRRRQSPSDLGSDLPTLDLWTRVHSTSGR